MAKQSGLHQIRGKVGEHSYYRQTGVSSGLIRSINQGMSQRVKTGEEFANTRLNNAEFGQACRIAGVLGQFITPKFRPMILPFSQSKMAKQIVTAIKDKEGNWGQRNLSATDLDVFLQTINSVHKNNPDDFGLSYSIDDNDNFLITPDPIVFRAKMESIGADGCSLTVLAARPWIGNFVVANRQYLPSYARSNVYTGIIEPDPHPVPIDYTFPPAPSSSYLGFYVDFLVVVIMPFRIINSQRHILQEHCTFIAMDLPASE